MTEQQLQERQKEIDKFTNWSISGRLDILTARAAAACENTDATVESAGATVKGAGATVGSSRSTLENAVRTAGPDGTTWGCMIGVCGINRGDFPNKEEQGIGYGISEAVLMTDCLKNEKCKAVQIDNTTDVKAWTGLIMDQTPNTAYGSTDAKCCVKPPLPASASSITGKDGDFEDSDQPVENEETDPDSELGGIDKSGERALAFFKPLPDQEKDRFLDVVMLRMEPAHIAKFLISCKGTYEREHGKGSWMEVAKAATWGVYAKEEGEKESINQSIKGPEAATGEAEAGRESKKEKGKGKGSRKRKDTQ